MNLLIVYGTGNGQTQKICEFLENQAESAGYNVSLANSAAAQVDPSAYDTVIIAASMRAGGYQKTITRYLERFHEQLKELPGIFLSVSLTAAGTDETAKKDLESLTVKYLQKCGWEPYHIEYLAGALHYTKYGLITRFIMRQISKKAGGDTDTSRDYEYTDWNQVKNIIQKIKEYEPLPEK